MPAPGIPISAAFRRPLRTPWPWVGLGFCLALTLLVWQIVRRAEQERLTDLQAAQATTMATQLQTRVEDMTLLLRGAAGYLGRGSLPARAEWHDYVESLDLAASHPGIQGMGFAEWIPRSELTAHVERLRKEGFPDYHVIPGGALPADPEGCSSIIYLEPMDARNQRAFSKDMFAEPVRREAMVRARDRGLVTLSGPVTLFQETLTGVQVGTLLFAPVYRQGALLETVADRRKAFRGWVYFPLRMSDLVSAVLARNLRVVDLRVTDGATDMKAPLFESEAAKTSEASGLLARQSIEVAGRTWVLQVQPNALFFEQAGRKRHWEIVIGGCAGSLLLFAGLVSILGAESRARELARQRGDELLASEARLSALGDQLPDCFLFTFVQPTGAPSRFTYLSTGVEGLCGVKAAEVLKDARALLHQIDPTLLPAFREAAKASARGLSPFIMDLRQRRPDGEWRWFRASAMPRGQADGSVIWDGVSIDITDQKLALLALEEGRAKLEHQARRYAQILATSQDAIHVIDHSGRLREWNPAFLAHLGYSEEEAAGLQLSDWDRQWSEEELLAMIGPASRGPARFETIHRRKDGSLRHVEISATGIELDGEELLFASARDMTDSVRAREAMSLSHARYQGLFDLCPDGISVTRLSDGALIEVNAAWQQMFGFTREEALGRGTLDLGVYAHPEDRRALLEQVSKTGSVSTFTIELLKKDGGLLIAELNGRVTNINGEPCLVVVLRDETLKETMRTSLQESEARFRAVAEESPVAIFLYRDDRFIYVNPAGVALLKARGPEDLVGTSMLARVHPERRELVRHRVAEAVEQGLSKSVGEERLLALDGTVLEVEVQGRPIMYGGLPAVMSFVQDIGQRKRDTEALVESEARFRSLADTAPVLIWLSDANGLCTYFNQSWLTWTGLNPEQAYGRGWAAFIHPEDLPRCAEAASAHFKSHEPFTLEFRLRHHSGAYRWISDRGTPRFASDGSFLGFIGAGIDIQDLKDAESAVWNSEFRARKAESLVLMAGGIAHDFNNLFQGVLGYLEIAASKARDNASLVGTLNKAVETLRRAIGLSWKMLDFSGRGLMKLESLDLESWLPAFLATLHLELPPTFQLDLACETVPCIEGDPSKLEQVVRAVVDNAREAAGAEGGRVHVRLRPDFGEDRPGSASPGVWPLARPDGPATVCLEISDEGPGLRADQLNLICDPFYTTKELGRGLGLAAAVGILRAHHAGLHILGGEGKGLILRMHFPPGGA
ncbi:MAG TPA: PAS domain S-box protein [Geothrix sp.]|nr:PAS domain S-box protein [Geothrix sp.]